MWYTMRPILYKTLFLLSLMPLFNAAGAEDYTPQSLLVTLFTDGKALIEYRVDSDVTLPRITIPLFGSIIEELLILDDENQLVDYRVENGTLVMDTFGAASLLITYTASDLVNKTGSLWTFSVDSPLDTSIKLPANSVIVGWNENPTSIKADDNQYLLVMPAGQAEISYVLGVLGTKEHANAAISDAERMVTELRTDGIVAGAATGKLDDAKKAFERGNYGDAERLAEEAADLADTARQEAGAAGQAMDKARSAVQEAEGQGTGVEEAGVLLGMAVQEYDLGNYTSALALAQQAEDAITAKVPAPEDGDSNVYMYAAVGGAAAAAGGAAAYMRSRKRTVMGEAERPVQIITEKRVVDLDRIFGEKPYLRPEDKDAINFLAEKGGEAFESELREKFQLPKTTMWRLVKRLEREELVEIKKAGGQNLIRIRGEFTKTGRPEQ